jgi:hypothetical protein
MTREIPYQKERYNILIKGTLSSGSSAVKNLLREYENINSFKGEFDDFRAPGLVADQLSYKSSVDYPNRIDEILKIKSRLLQFIYNTIPKKIWSNALNFKIFNYKENKLLFPFKKHSKETLINKLSRNKSNFFLNKDILIRFNQLYFLEELNKSLKSEISFEEKIQNSYKWIQNIARINAFEKGYTLFDQPLDPSSDIDIWTKVFKPYKLICVFRNPKDQLAEMVKRGVLFSPFKIPQMTFTGVNILSIYGKNRKGMFKFLVEALKKRLEEYDNLERILDTDKLLIIDFEGLVNKYEAYKSIIENFLGITNKNHKLKNIYFDPDTSKNNIGIYRNYLSEEDLEGISELEEWYINRIKNQNQL